jgi:hypothetical protein
MSHLWKECKDYASKVVLFRISKILCGTTEANGKHKKIYTE